MLFFLISILILCGCIRYEINLMFSLNFSIFEHTLITNSKPIFKIFNAIMAKNLITNTFTTFVPLMAFTCASLAPTRPNKLVNPNVCFEPSTTSFEPCYSKPIFHPIIGWKAGSSSYGSLSLKYSTLYHSQT